MLFLNHTVFVDAFSNLWNDMYENTICTLIKVESIKARWWYLNIDNVFKLQMLFMN